MIRRLTRSTLFPYPMLFLFFFNDTATTEIYPLSLHDALPISVVARNSPVEQHVFHLRAFADVVHYHPASALRGFLVHHDSNVIDPVTQVPCDQIAGRIVL